ncbi:LbtU family siderophore porin [Piscirickettsia litoralis]|uniref:Porin n=1 Tax=Piscirickettsia litoralis TaxID=1891921 RepID=A0ABX3A4C5_9GAMM|nr:LbtU family siderophore porin [Piscirickettsia litoralis]ODN43712.1 hypothetical protein BGC07_13410 [Piscirickettsia litoralis]
MKLKLITCSVALSLAASTAFAATADSLKLELDKLKASQAALEKQVEALKTGKGKEGGAVHFGRVGGGKITSQSSRFGRDLGMLKLLKKAGEDAPRFTLGGILEADISYGKDTTAADSGVAGDGIYNTNGYAEGQTASSIYLDTVRLDILAKLNDWVLVDWQLDIAKSSPLRTGFVTFGNLSKSPVYFSLGKIVPYFGDFGGHTYNNPLSTDYFRISKGKLAGTLGYYQDNLNISASVFETDRGTAADNHVNDWTLQANYAFKVGQVKAKVGAGYVRDITGHALRGMTAKDTKDPLPAANISAKMAVGPVSFKVNYAQTLKDVARTVTTESKKVSAYNLQAGYSTKIIKPVDFSISYSGTKNANGTTSSKSQFKNLILVGAGVSVLPSTYISLEYGNMAQYADPTSASSDTNRYSVLTLDFWLTF